MIESYKDIIYAVVAILLIWLFLRSIYLHISMFFARRAAVKNPTEENAWKVYQLLKAKLGITINNHPKDWAKFREMFYAINGSSDVPSELKQQIKNRLIKKGLYINNVRIIDNYKANKKPEEVK